MLKLLRRLAAVLAATLLPTAAMAQSTAERVLPGFLSTTGCVPGQTVCWLPYNSTNPTPTSDPNNAPYSRAVAITVGGVAITATRGVAADCTASGTATLTMSGSGSLSWTVAPGHQNQPYSVTGISASTATCTFYGLN